MPYKEPSQSAKVQAVIRMPLIKGKSKKSFEKNVETEMHEGKPKAQSLAIAYQMKKKAKKMAMGGDASHQSEAHDEEMLHQPEDSLPADYTESMGKKERAMRAFAGGGFIGSHQPEGKGHTIHIQVNPQAEADTGAMHPQKMAEGGMAHQDDSHEMDMVDRVMKKRGQCYSEGGKVANMDSGESTDDPESFAKSDPNEFDDLAMRDDLESDYTGENSGDEDGSELNQDFVGKIMRKRSKK